MKKKKKYFICVRKSDNRAVISTSKCYISDIVGVSVDTIRRHLEKSKYYETNEFIICRDVEIHTIKRGFAL